MKNKNKNRTRASLFQSSEDGKQEKFFMWPNIGAIYANDRLSKEPVNERFIHALGTEGDFRQNRQYLGLSTSKDETKGGLGKTDFVSKRYFRLFRRDI